MSLVLGLSNGGHDCSAAVFMGGKLGAAISGERLSRRKCQGGDIPQLAIDAVRADVALNGRVAANVKLNQRIVALPALSEDRVDRIDALGHRVPLGLQAAAHAGWLTM